MAFGGSIDAVARNEMAMSAQQRVAMEATLERLLRQQEQSRQHAVQDRQLSQRDAAQQQQQRQFDEQMQADAAREGRLTNQFDANLGMQRDQLRERQRDRRMDMLQRRRVFTFNEQDKSLRTLLPHAAAMADEGMFENIEDVIKQFPSLAQQAPMLAGRSSAARRAIEGDLAAETADATLLNEGPAQINRLQHMQAMEKEDSWNPDRNPWWRSNEPDPEALNEWSMEAANIRAATEGIHRDRGRVGRLTPDTAGRYSPSTTLPWRPRGTPPTVVDGPTATNPQTGEKIIFRNGQWQPLQ